MSQEQFNELVKRMLDFGHNTQPRSPSAEETEKVKSVTLEQGKVNDITLPPLKEETSKLPRKERRNQERVAKRLEKNKKKNAEKEDASKNVRLRLDKAKEETRKSAFSDEDRNRIERVLFNKTK